MNEHQIRAYIRKAIKDKYRTIKRCAYSRGISASAIYVAFHTGRLPKWMLEEFGVVRKIVYEVTKMEEWR